MLESINQSVRSHYQLPTKKINHTHTRTHTQNPGTLFEATHIIKSTTQWVIQMFTSHSLFSTETSTLFTIFVSIKLQLKVKLQSLYLVWRAGPWEILEWAGPWGCSNHILLRIRMSLSRWWRRCSSNVRYSGARQRVGLGHIRTEWYQEV